MTFGQEVDGGPVAARRDVGVDVDGGRGAGVAEPLGSHRNRYAGGEHVGGHDVPRSCSRKAAPGRRGRGT
jgi:hypothetical protein